MAAANSAGRRRWLWLLAYVLAFVAFVVLQQTYGGDEAGPGGSTSAPAPAPSSAAAAEAVELLKSLAVREPDPSGGYDRALFGPAWTDDVTVAGGRNGCDTRNDVLKRDLVNIKLAPVTKECTVEAGTLYDPYTGREIYFRRGVDTSSAVQIDHVVALSDAWQKGARLLDAQARKNLANDPRNLQAVDGPTNQGKGDKDAAQWLPPNSEYRCTYVSRQIEVKAEYGLWITPDERDAMAGVLATC
ncbi:MULTISPECIES: HNH endonuclease family protein [Rhodococcus]|uniref:HNH endonuclease family protein n=1 Tax=Rhodococcus aetherivorans TaxID=191292 RepID=A0A059MH76_9NOCA|nr:MULTISPECIES: HNH endonuclease family protein [Rhodococcus]ETT27328.1 protein of unknown function DUF1524 RloF [Rhodococcus rhodochrous ATCC 21198]AKE91532.1 lipoprotein [Rhodococcus aetherivorans]ANZ23637.1 hypothetical protein A4U64_02170 [Rhodococcus sp. WB1]KDE10564.1 hypothetical protein N505_0120195 [Rhodococcus aetherivorans]MBC2589362.1 HNH endonuclease [Rhodococcus aetherivorans]